jgi:predicted O-methyltransferase YrrM
MSAGHSFCGSQQPEGFPVHQFHLKLDEFQREVVATLKEHTEGITVVVDRLVRLEQKVNQCLPAAQTPPSVPVSAPASAQPPVPGPAARRFDIVYRTPAHMSMAERIVLYSLVIGLRPERSLEIGTHKGGSALIIVAALDDLCAGTLACIDPNPVIAPEHRQAMSHRATLLAAPSPAAVPEAARAVEGKFHFVFIDGDHTTDGVFRDIEGVLAYLEVDAHLLFHDAHNAEVAEGIRLAVQRYRNSLIDCGMISTEKNRQPGASVAWGGLRLLRFKPA